MKDAQTLMTEAADVSWWELADMKQWFEKEGKRFGLLKEFRENGII